MSFITAITGAAVVGLTTPTYTLTPDLAPAVNAKQWLVSALAGTQAGVTTHSVSYPFTVSVFRPLVPRVSPVANKSTGVVVNNPTNTYKIIFRKGTSFNLNPLQIGTTLATLTLNVPANSDSVDAVEVKALISMMCGYVHGNSQAIADLALLGVLS